MAGVRIQARQHQSVWYRGKTTLPQQQLTALRTTHVIPAACPPKLYCVRPKPSAKEERRRERRIQEEKPLKLISGFSFIPNAIQLASFHPGDDLHYQCYALDYLQDA